jgi:hypothetical protein
MKRSSTWFASILTKLGLRPNAEPKPDEKSDEKNPLDALAEYSRYDPRETGQISNPKTQGEDDQRASSLPTVSGEHESGNPTIVGKDADSHRSPAKNHTEHWIMLFTAILAATAIVTNFQTCRALRDSQRTFETSQRPYVFIKHLALEPLKVGQQINGTAEWINTGNLPALNAAMAAGIVPMKECPQNEAAGTDSRPERDIPPKIEQRPYHVHSREVLSQADYDGYLAGTIKICFFGMVVYKDGFNAAPIVKPFCGEQTIKSPDVLICPALNTEYND